MTSRVPTLGAVLGPDGTSFAVFSRGSTVDLVLADEGGAETRVPLRSRTQDVWHGVVEGVGPGQRYGFRVDGPWDPHRGHRFDRDALLVDPYARAIDGQWSVVVDSGFDWGGDRPPVVAWEDTVVYELHVRGFTKLHPAIPQELRGSYAALAHPDSVGHLLDLGVTTVELLPVHEIRPEPALARRGLPNYWGYNTLGFFAPHSGYSSAGTRGQQVSEFKTMVRDLHAAGLEVVLDVVYNHTAEGGLDGSTLCWRGLDNEAYYRLRHDGTYDDVTGCGNSLDLRHPRCLQMVTDSLRYWVQEMHVDGFRFDLAPTLARGSSGFDRASAFFAVLDQDPVLSRVKLIAEPWDVGPGGYQLGGFPAPWAEWNDRFRDTVRASWLASRGGPPTGGMRDLAYRLSGSSDIFETSGRGPLASVNFVTAHDGFTLHDLVSYDHKRNEANGEDGRDGSSNNHSWNCGTEGPTGNPAVLALRRRMMRNLMATQLMSAGVPMLTAGDETARTQHGNNNAYCLDDETSWLSWDHADWQRDLYSWARALLAVRREHEVLRTDEFFEGRPAHEDDVIGAKDLTWYGPDGSEMSPERWFDHHQQVLGMRLAHTSNGTGDPSSLLVLLNTGPTQQDVTLPDGPTAASYTLLLDTTDERPARGHVLAAGATAALGPYSVQVLAVHQE